MRLPESGHQTHYTLLVRITPSIECPVITACMQAARLMDYVCSDRLTVAGGYLFLSGMFVASSVIPMYPRSSNDHNV